MLRRSFIALLFAALFGSVAQAQLSIEVHDHTPSPGEWVDPGNVEVKVWFKGTVPSTWPGPETMKYRWVLERDGDMGETETVWETAEYEYDVQQGTSAIRWISKTLNLEGWNGAGGRYHRLIMIAEISAGGPSEYYVKGFNVGTEE